MIKRLQVFTMVWLVFWTSSQELVGQEETSQDGKIAFVSDRSGHNQIYVMDADGSNVQRLTFSDGIDTSPDWSPDGLKLVFQSLRDGKFGIYIMNADGSDLINLVNDSDRDPAWSPGGNTIAFVRDVNEGSDIYTVNVDGSNLRKVVEGGNGTFNLFPTWSPDGNDILYITTDEVRGGRNPSTYFELKTVNIATGEQHLLYSLSMESAPDWSWVRNREEIAIAFDNLGSTTIVRLKADGSSTNARSVTLAPDPFGDLSRYDEHPTWSPDGTKIAFSSWVLSSAGSIDITYDIYVTDANEEQMTNLTPNSDSNDIMPDWQPIIVDSQLIIGFVLVDAGTEEDIRPLADGDTITEGTITIRVETEPPIVGSVVFGLDDEPRYKVENEAAYALKGDDNGDYHAWLAEPGTYRLTATPYTEADGEGEAGTPLTITFTVEAPGS